MASRGQCDLFYGISKQVPDEFMVSVAGFGSELDRQVSCADTSPALRWTTEYFCTVLYLTSYFLSSGPLNFL